MEFYGEKGVLQILDNSLTGTRNARTEGVLGIIQFNNHHPTSQFTHRDAEVMREKACARGHRVRRESQDKNPGLKTGSLVLVPLDQAGIFIQK